MKKLLSVVMAVIMILSCCSLAVNALYLETVTETKYLNNVRDKEKVLVDNEIQPSQIYTELGVVSNDLTLQSLSGADFMSVLTKVYSLPEGEYQQILDKEGNAVLDEFGSPMYYQENVTKQLTVLGMPLNMLFNANMPFMWDTFTAHPEKYQSKYPDKILVDISKSDINLLIANINMYMLRMLKSLYSNYRFYTEDNALVLINTIGKILDPNFVAYSDADKRGFFAIQECDREVEIDTDAGKVIVRSYDEQIFFERVSDLSGLSTIIQNNWIDYGATLSNYKVLIKLLGVSEGYLLEREYMSGTKVGAAILSCAYTRIMGEGPINYFLSVFKPLIKTYNSVYFTPIKLLFSLKRHMISEEEFATMTGLLNLIVNNNDEGNGYQFAPLPEVRLMNAEDTSEFNLILLAYLNVNNLFSNNKWEIENTVKNALDNFGSKYACKDYTNELYNMIYYITNDIDGAFFAYADLTKDAIEAKPEEFKGNIKEALEKMIQRIIDWFRMWMEIFNGDREFGA